MKSVRAASALLAAGWLCNVASAGFPNSSLNAPSQPNAGQPNYAIAQNQYPHYPTTQVPQGGVIPASCATNDCGGGAPVYTGAPVGDAPVYQSGPVYSAPVPEATGPACGDGGYGYQATPYYNAMNSAWTAAPVVSSGNAGCPTWFGSAYGLVMTRASDDPFYFGSSDLDLTRLYLRNSDAANQYAGGVETRIGRTFNCCKYGLELGYWGLYPNAETAEIIAPNVPGNLMSRLDYSRVYVFGAPDPVTGLPVGVPMTNYTNDLQLIRITRDYDVQNIELNLISGPLVSASGGCGSACGPCGPAGPCDTGACGNPYGYAIGDGCYCGPAPVARPRLNIGWGLGVRYFKFDENLFIAMDNLDQMIDYPTNPNVNEVFHEVDVENNLVGVQLGLNADYFLTKCFSFDLGTKFGLYGNHVNHYQRIFNSNGAAYVLPTAPADFTIRTSDDDVAFLGEIRAGVGYKVSKHIRLTGGYRAVAATGVATAIDQLEDGRNMSALWKVGDVERGDLLLHGAYAGLDFAW